MPDIFGKIVQGFLNSGYAEGFSGIVGGLVQREIWRQVEGLIHIQCRNQLPGKNIPAGVTGNDDGKKRFVIKAFLTEQTGEAVDESRQVRRKGIVVIRAEHDERVRFQYSRPDFLLHQSAIKTASFFTKMDTHGVGTAGTI